MNPATDDLPPLSPAALFGGFGITTMNHRQTINAAALEIARVSGWDIDPDHDFVAEAERDINSLKLQEFKTHARSGDFLRMAEAAFAVITGDRPDYDGDEPND